MSEKSSDVVTQEKREPYGYNEWVEAMNKPGGRYVDEDGIEYLDVSMPNLNDYRKHEDAYDVYNWKVIFAAKNMIDNTRKLAGVGFDVIEMDKPIPKQKTKKDEMKMMIKEALKELLEDMFKKD